MISVIDRLETLGFKAAADRVKKAQERKRKLAIAYEHFRFVRVEKISEFNDKLYEQTRHDNEGYKELSFTSIERYENTPPEHVLVSLGEAVAMKCFDSFEVASIRRVKDPILFGRIDECSDRFFIDQWDEDVRIEDILKDNEG